MASQVVDFGSAELTSGCSKMMIGHIKLLVCFNVTFKGLWFKEQRINGKIMDLFAGSSQFVQRHSQISFHNVTKCPQSISSGFNVKNIHFLKNSCYRVLHSKTQLTCRVLQSLQLQTLILTKTQYTIQFGANNHLHWRCSPDNNRSLGKGQGFKSTINFKWRTTKKHLKIKAGGKHYSRSLAITIRLNTEFVPD